MEGCAGIASEGCADLSNAGWSGGGSCVSATAGARPKNRPTAVHARSRFMIRSLTLLLIKRGVTRGKEGLAPPSDTTSRGVDRSAFLGFVHTFRRLTNSIPKRITGTAENGRQPIGI